MELSTPCPTPNAEDQSPDLIPMGRGFMYPHKDERTLFIRVPFLSIFLRKHLQQYSLRALTEKESLFSVKIRGAPPSITPQLTSVVGHL
ncbi:hypothetical protein CEXT_625211 [Caerostris extrusa]|uniref:Uncharacterized protein n=1 Tax=Caerostris extrusa TaxID=172846 RepID=A0AAV4NEW3_CAEEX|nr:hypothetical protein CEXT_625211 [Caerostris extrusa]